MDSPSILIDMVVKICFAFGLLALSVLLICLRPKFFKVIGFLGLLLWLFIGDWGGLELAKKLFLWITHGHLFHFVGIIIGIFVAVMFIGGLIPSGGGSATKGSSVKVKNVTKQTEAPRDVWVVNGKEFASRGEASMYVKQFPYMDESWIRQERR